MDKSKGSASVLAGDVFYALLGNGAPILGIIKMWFVEEPVVTHGKREKPSLMQSIEKTTGAYDSAAGARISRDIISSEKCTLPTHRI